MRRALMVLAAVETLTFLAGAEGLAQKGRLAAQVAPWTSAASR